MYAVVVTFQVQEAKMPEFLPAMIENARTSLACEEGCLRFDVCIDNDRADEIFLYELYTDHAAFQVHLQSAHFRAFDCSVAPLVASKEIRTYREVVS